MKFASAQRSLLEDSKNLTNITNQMLRYVVQNYRSFIIKHTADLPVSVLEWASYAHPGGVAMLLIASGTEVRDKR